MVAHRHESRDVFILPPQHADGIRFFCIPLFLRTHISLIRNRILYGVQSLEHRGERLSDNSTRTTGQNL